MRVKFQDRPGRFAISMELINEATEEELGLLFSRVRVWRVEPDVCSGMLIYSATSPRFRHVKAGEEAPWYRFMLTRDDEGQVDVDIQEATEPMWVHTVPPGYGEGVVKIPAGLRLVDAEGREVARG